MEATGSNQKGKQNYVNPSQCLKYSITIFLAPSALLHSLPQPNPQHIKFSKGELCKKGKDSIIKLIMMAHRWYKEERQRPQ